MTASEAICEEPFVQFMRREACLKFNQNQVFRQRMCLGLKTEPAQWWRGDVQDGTGAGGAQCRARTLAPAHTGSALCPLVCLRLGVRPIHRQPCLGHSCLQQHGSEAQRDRAAAYIIIPRTGPSPQAHRGSHYPPSFGDEIFHSCRQFSKTNSLVKNGSVYTFGKNSPMEAFNKAYHLLLPHFIWEWWIKRMIP